jgi:molybdate transport system ATP-binding protein
VFQNHLLFPHLSALENVAFGLRARGMRRSVAREEAAAWLDRLGIGNVGEQRPGALSGGQAQRVALARALALEPRLLLFDEPLAALDVTTRVQVRRELARQLDGFDGARLLVTHDPVEAMALADRVLVIEAGRVQQCGTIAELRARPRSRYVADVVGVNLYRGRARGDQVRTDDGVELAIVNDEGVDGEVFVMVHPEAVSVHRRRPEGSPRNAWCGTVRNIDRAARHVRVDVDAAVAVTAEITEQSLADLELAPGSEVWVSVKATEIAMFPA